MKRTTTITLAIAGLLAMTGILHAASSTQFGSAGSVVGVAATQTDLLVTEYCTQAVDTVDCSGKVSLFAMLPGDAGCTEKYLTIAPAQSANAGFTPRDVFVTQGALVYKISGGSVTWFANIPGATTDHTGITFDHVGTFGYNMIVTTEGGGVWKLDGSGNPTQIADVGTMIEGPAVVPANFGPYGGQILVGAENEGQVHAIAANGQVTYDVFDWYGAEGVVVIPATACTYCSSGTPGAFFQATENAGLYKYSASSFTGLGGSVLVTSEYGAGTAIITFDGVSYNQTTFDNIPGAVVEGSSWTDCDVPPPPASPTPQPSASASPAATHLAVSAATGTYGGTTTFTATLTRASDNTPITGETVSFTLNGNSAGSGVTDANGLATSSTVALTAGTYNAGSYPTGAAASFAGDGTYGASSGTNSLTVSPAVLTVSADSKSRAYGTANPPLSASYTGFVNSENLSTSGVTGQPTLWTDATQFSAVGSYYIHIAQGNLAANNYTFNLVDGKLTIYLCGGIIGLNWVTVGASSAVVDAYNSSVAPYPQSESNQAFLASNGTITLQGAKVYGDMVSTLGKVVLQANSLVTGDVLYATTLTNSGTLQTQPTHQTSAAIVAPIPGACGSYTAAPTQANMWITGVYTYDPIKGNLTVSGGGTAILANGSYCFNNVTVSGGSTLVINGPVKISVTGKFVDSGGSLQNTSYIPANLQVTSSYTGSNGVTVSGTSSTYINIYAPGTDVTVSGGGPLYGALLGKTLTVSGNSAVHEDLGLCSQ